MSRTVSYTLLKREYVLLMLKRDEALFIWSAFYQGDRILYIRKGDFDLRGAFSMKPGVYRFTWVFCTCIMQVSLQRCN